MNEETRYIAYCRVSATAQEHELTAQEHELQAFVSSSGGIIMDVFKEIESGRNDDRTTLAKALLYCRLKGAALLVSRMDRLSCSLGFVAGLMNSGVKIICADNPYAQDIELHMMAIMAEHRLN